MANQYYNTTTNSCTDCTNGGRSDGNNGCLPGPTTPPLTCPAGYNLINNKCESYCPIWEKNNVLHPNMCDPICNRNTQYFNQTTYKCMDCPTGQISDGNNGCVLAPTPAPTPLVCTPGYAPNSSGTACNSICPPWRKNNPQNPSQCDLRCPTSTNTYYDTTQFTCINCPNGGTADNNNTCIVSTPTAPAPAKTSPDMSNCIQILQTKYGNICYVARTSSITITVKDIPSIVSYVQISNTGMIFQNQNTSMCFSTPMKPIENSVTWTDYGVYSKDDMKYMWFTEGMRAFQYPMTTYPINNGNVYSIHLPPKKEFTYLIDFFDTNFKLLDPGLVNPYPLQNTGFVNRYSLKISTTDGSPEVLPPETNKCYSNNSTQSSNSGYNSIGQIIGSDGAICTNDSECNSCRCNITSNDTNNKIGYCETKNNLMTIMQSIAWNARG